MKKSRVYILFAGILIFAVALIGRLYIVQVTEGDQYRTQAERQYVQRNYHLYDRGDIYFTTRDGDRVSAATLQSGYMVWIDPRAIDDPDEVYEELRGIVDVDRERFFSRYERGGTYAPVVPRVDLEVAHSVRSLRVDGLSVHPQRWRFYPGEATAAHVLGFIGFQGDDLAGRSGLERMYDNVLERTQNEYRVNFFAEFFANIARGFSGEDEEGDVVTTIEPTVQASLEKSLKEIESEWGPSEVGGIILDPSTGEVRAMAALPAFDPNNVADADNRAFKNIVVENVYEMGSVVKALTLAAGLDARVITPGSTYTDHGFVEIDGARINNHDGRARGVIDMQQVINDSVNTGVVHVMEEMGSAEFARYMREFGFDSKTGIDLPNEAENIIRNFDSPRRVEYATASFGQGVAVTPIGMARALSTLANGGRVIDPYVVDRIELQNGDVVSVADTRNTDPHQVISEETSREITRMLVNVVDDALLHGEVALPRYTVAAKTGTAQIPGPGGYREGDYLHSFFGYFPAYDPEFLILLYALEPRGVQHASESLTHPFMDLTTFLINYYRIPPDR